MKFQDAENDVPEVIYEGFKFPNQYAVFGNAPLYELDENNVSALVYVGNRVDIENLIKEMDVGIDCAEEDDFVVVALWDNHTEKNKDDYLMIAGIVSHSMESNPFRYIKSPNSVHKLTDSSTSDSDAWRAWGNLCQDYMYNSVNEEEMQKVAKVLLQNVSETMLNNFRNYAEDDFLKSLLPKPNKLKL